MSAVATRAHEWVELYRRGHLMIPGSDGRLRPMVREPDLEAEGLDAVADSLVLPTIPHYVVDDRCIELLGTETSSRSIHALRRAGLADLQHEHAIVEFDREHVGGGRSRFIVFVSRRRTPILEGEGLYHPYLCRVLGFTDPDYESLQMIRARAAVADGRAPSVWGVGEMPRRWAVASRMTYMIENVEAGYVDPLSGRSLDHDGFHFAGFQAPWIRDGAPGSRPGCTVDESFSGASGVAVRCLLVLLRTRGLVREDVSVPRLNKTRAARGRPPVPDHCVVRMGTYYARSGEARRLADPTASWHQPFHWRGPHTKRVWYGPRGSQQSREVLIEGYFVNYEGEGEPPPDARVRVVRPGPGQREEA